MKYQLHCPKCHYEFTYDNGYYDRNIARLGQEIHELHIQIAAYKTLPSAERKRKAAERRQAVQKLQEKVQEISELKAIRKVSDQQINHATYQIFKDMVKEEFGEQAYKKLMDKVLKEVEAYKVSGLMWHEYSKPNSKSSVTSINKL